MLKGGTGYMKNTSETKSKWKRWRGCLIRQSTKDYCDTLPRDEARNIATVEHTILHFAQKNTGCAHKFVNIPAKMLMHCITDGRKYKPTLNALEARGMEIKRHYVKGAGVTRAYRIPEEPLVSVNYSERRSRRTIKSMKQVIDENEMCAYLSEQYEQLEVVGGQALMDKLATHDIQRGEKIVHTDGSADAFDKMEHGKVSVHRKREQGRLTHTIMGMCRELRVFIRHKSGQTLVEGDIKCCHPWLLIDWCNAEEKPRYTNLVAKDLYLTIAEWAGESRDIIKDKHNIWMNGGILGTEVIRDFYNIHFPCLAELVRGRGKANAPALQELEARIVVDELVPACMEDGLFMLPQHDGFLCLEKDFDVISEKLVQACQRVTGRTCTVTKKVFSQHIEFVPKTRESCSSSSKLFNDSETNQNALPSSLPFMICIRSEFHTNPETKKEIKRSSDAVGCVRELGKIATKYQNMEWMDVKKMNAVERRRYFGAQARMKEGVRLCQTNFVGKPDPEDTL